MKQVDDLVLCFILEHLVEENTGNDSSNLDSPEKWLLTIVCVGVWLLFCRMMTRLHSAGLSSCSSRHLSSIHHFHIVSLSSETNYVSAFASSVTDIHFVSLACTSASLSVCTLVGSLFITKLLV